MFCSQCGTTLNDGSKFCSACGHSVPSHRQAPVETIASNPDPIQQQPQFGTNYGQHSIDFSNLDTTMDEIQMISESRKANSANRRKAMLVAVPVAIIVTLFGFILENITFFYEYKNETNISLSGGFWSYLWDSTFNFEWFSTWFWPHNDDFFITNPHLVEWFEGAYISIVGLTISSIILYYYLGYRSQSLWKGGILKANSLISSFEQNVQQHPNYPRLGEFNIVKSEFESATKAAGIFGIFLGIILALIAILAIFSGRDNNRRY